ncbi:PepSY domain-containing protein [Paenibacillus thiaminolyticus]|uniref:PepSY domain-containing protein n=1 Tax=Paenibacillus thiaminolyticus TaxID=49283 RepID=A0AAP9DWT4_PANTH|nr:PepSY domain-containing protein [Paenibacillus thiaminolyticus]MCY9535289.1 PepSY domain-containing protein [Paenibacillus thiaminolyticus]MCY9602550.1 PepSY domain-containing protein [Paenibacillus thiaminolyticus]MCY9606202.1 PepSY domain-containing protein [Paenibacillus thiaminolyticus]MCY9612587.1 PepSY domain-containing protein [Paenibacillus thiaminolyticus]MCY9620784.1 PepSY domain-containing protein [Paenibacillus thiaminolyticus]
MKRTFIAGIAGLLLLGGAVGGVAAADKANGAVKSSSYGSELLTSKQAEEIALREVNGDIRSVELKKENGRMVFEVEIRTADGRDDNEVTLDAVSGKVLQVEWDDDDDADERHRERRQGQAQDRTAAISKKQAIAIALQDTPGRVIEADSGKHVYEIEIRNGNREVEYKIDKFTGKIVEKDVDDDDDDEWDND